MPKIFFYGPIPMIPPMTMSKDLENIVGTQNILMESIYPPGRKGCIWDVLCISLSHHSQSSVPKKSIYNLIHGIHP